MTGLWVWFEAHDGLMTYGLGYFPELAVNLLLQVLADKRPSNGVCHMHLN